MGGCKDYCRPRAALCRKGLVRHTHYLRACRISRSRIVLSCTQQGEHERLALQHGETSKAIAFLQVAVPYDLGSPRSATFVQFGALHPVYVRGQAYLAARQGAEAAKEFQKIVDHRGIVIGDAFGSLAHLGLVRAYLLSGDTAKARAKYEDFLAIWKDAERWRNI